MMKKVALLFLINSTLVIFSSASAQNYFRYVNPFIGTGGHGHTFPGAVTPFGMVQLSPDTRIDGSWDGCGGYYYNDSVIYGFSHTHLSGTGCSDYGDIAFLPLLLPVDSPISGSKLHSVTFNHKNEIAEAAYYSVLLDNAVKVELTATPRVGLQRYTFNKSGDAYIILNLEHRDELLEGSIHERSSTHFSGIRRSKAWAVNQVLYYDFSISKPYSGITYVKNEKNDLRVTFMFKVKVGEQILISTGISACDEAGALNNRTSELPGWDFEKTKKAAQDLWNKELSKIDIDHAGLWPNEAQQAELMKTYEKENVSTPTKELPYPPSINFPTSEAVDKATIFYTALYHCMIHPSLYSDVDNRYRGRDNKIHSTEGKFDYYTVFSLWDTYRALHPLLTIIDTKRTNDFINTFLCQYQQGGRLPVWELSSNETDCMIGYHSVSVIWDAYNKGIRNYDANLAFEAMKQCAMEDRNGLKFYKAKGYISSEDDNDGVSKTLEYAYDDWCIAQMAKALGKTDDYNYFNKRSQNWKNLFNPDNGFFQAKKNGSWIKNFDPYEVNNNYTEANAWQYSVAVPHDLATLNTMYKSGGLKQHLDQLFAADENTKGRKQADISGLIGQYAHGNEPSHHMIYCYTATPNSDANMRKLITKTNNEFYRNTPDGLIGNEDCGQMSAWYVLSALGIYQVCPGDLKVALGRALFKSAKIQMNNNSFFQTRIIGDAGAPLKQVLCNDYECSNQILFTTLENSQITFNHSASKLPSKGAANDWIPNISLGYQTAPYFNNPSKNFNDTFRVEIKTIDNSSIYYSMNGKEYLPYKSAFLIHTTSTISAYAMNETTKEKSAPVTSEFRKLPYNRQLQLLTSYDNQYSAAGPNAMIDLERGTTNWRIGNWQGYAGKDFIGIVDLGTSKELKSIGLGCLQDQGAWVMMPPQLVFEGSNDGKTFEPITTINTNVSDTISHAITKDVVVNFYTPSGQVISPEVQAVAVARPYRYYKVTAKNYGKLPQWHWSKGEAAWLFVDEILIEE